MDAAQAALDVHLSGYVPIYICELRQKAKNGEYIWMLDRGQVVERSPDGKPLRMIGIYTDITHHKYAEEELRLHRDSLKEMVEEQTTDLLRAKDLAETANAAKTQFLANMSHELRTPMHAVLSFARLGEEKASSALQMQQITPEKLPGYFQRIRESGDRLLALLNDLLDLSKLEAGRMPLRIQRINLQNIVQEALHEFEAILLSKHVTAAIHADGCDTLLMADAIRMAQVVRNLLSNAIKFSPEGSRIALSFQTGPQTGSGARRFVELTVADEGIGIPPDELDSVFDKFVQSSKTRSDAGGTGLGLAICREIVNAHHGQIFARNRAQQGAEFVVRIPRHPPADPLET
jgi:signal transduction histidine kinase